MSRRFGVTTIFSIAAAAAVPILSACGGGGPGAGAMPPASSRMTSAADTLDAASFARIDRANEAVDRRDTTTVLPGLARITTIGSTIDPINGDQNPYGLDIAPIDTGLLEKGDLVVCNFNDSANVQGTGTTIVALHPREHATPLHITQNANLNGCNALALGPTDTIWAAAFAANDNPIVAPNGTFVTGLPGGPWHHPFGETFSPAKGPFGNGAFYESNAMDGTIVRINLTEHGFTFDVIAKGFAVNNGVPGSILGPSGLQYDRARDSLIVVDGADNSVTVLRHVSRIPARGVEVHGDRFSGPAASLAHRIFAGPPLNGPISSALLPDGHLAIGNTLDPNGTNLIVELSRDGRVLATKNVDTGAAGAIFGMVATGTTAADVKLYFNDDNQNAVEVLTR